VRDRPVVAIATRNRDKLREILELLAGLPIVFTSFLDHPEVPEVMETGDTLRENALLKARAAARALGVPAVADDSGLEVRALGGAPGVLSSRFAGEAATYADNVRRLLEMMRAVPAGEREARFVCVAALVEPPGAGTGEGGEGRGTREGREAVVEGEVRGLITREPRGGRGFGYDPVFFVPELGRTFAEAETAEKQRTSHRARAFARVRELLEARLREGGLSRPAGMV